MPLARALKAATALAVVAVGLITEFEQAEAIITTGDADFIALARAMLYNPRWPWHAAAHFGASVSAPNQYLRAAALPPAQPVQRRQSEIAARSTMRMPA